MTKRYYIIYKGQVQGVGFRWRQVQLANKYGLTGYVRNLSNGDVETEVQGTSGIDEFIKESTSRDYFIIVEDYSLKQIDPVEDERTFTVLY